MLINTKSRSFWVRQRRGLLRGATQRGPIPRGYTRRVYTSLVMFLLCVSMSATVAPYPLCAQQVNPQQQQASTAQLRILDTTGLVRVARIVRESGEVRVKLAPQGDPKSGECVVTNLDGLAAERRAPVSTAGECVFSGLQAGSWQLRVPNDARWRAQIYE